ncbi:MAG: hypothetical protein JO119_01400 [Acidobacteria bacterium]|nr:hypothetical protein [Acidobacteriota bacterium]
MNRRVWLGSFVGLALLGVVAFALHHYFGGELTDPRDSALALIPTDTESVVFADIAQLRNAPFFSALGDWVQQPQQVDADYAKFLHDTGFDYERDLDRIAIATIKRGQTTEFFAIGDGRFDRKKINTYVSEFGTHDKKDGREIFTVPLHGSSNKISFAFLHQNRIVLTDDPDLPSLLRNPARGTDAKDWRERFDRLSGSPLFAVFRQDAGVGSAIATRTSNGGQAQQLASLIDHLQWITFAGVPEQNRLRVVVEGECPNDSTARDLADVLNGIRVFAQAGLNDPKVRHQLDDQTREAYIDLVHSADIARLDRGETKAVRLILEVTPEQLKAARFSTPLQAPKQVTPENHPPRTNQTKK